MRVLAEVRTARDVMQVRRVLITTTVVRRGVVGGCERLCGDARACESPEARDVLWYGEEERDER